MSSTGHHAIPAAIGSPGMSVTELRAELAAARGDLAYGAPCAVYHLTGALGSGKSWLADKVAADTGAPWIVVVSTCRPGEHLAHTMAAALIQGLATAGESLPGLQSLHDARRGAEGLLLQPGTDETFAALGSIIQQTGRAMSEIAGLGLSLVLDDIDLAPGWSRPALGQCLDDLATFRFPLLLALLRHGNGAWRTPDGLVVTAEIAPMTTIDIAGILPGTPPDELGEIQRWSEGRLLDVSTLAAVTDEMPSANLSERMSRADDRLLDLLGRRWEHLDATAWRYLEAVVRLGDDATHDAVRRLLGDSNRFGSGRSLVSEAGRALIEHRALSLGVNSQLVLGHRLLHFQVAARR